MRRALLLLALLAAACGDGPPSEHCCPCEPGEQLPECSEWCGATNACPNEEAEE